MATLRIAFLCIFCLSCWISVAIGADLPLKVTLFQNGSALKANSNGHYLLDQGEFTIRAECAGRPASIIATTDFRVLSQLNSIKRPLIAFPGFGAASSPGLLLIAEPLPNGLLELFPGWNEEFDKLYSVSQGSEVKAHYQALRTGMKSEPTIITSGRQYINFEPADGGAEEMLVKEMTDPVPPGKPLYLVIFAEDKLATTPTEIYSLDWAVLTVRFAPKSAAPRTEAHHE